MSTQVCGICNSKFLYRNAMYELMSKLEVRDEEMRMYQAEAQMQHEGYEVYLSKYQKQKSKKAQMRKIIDTDTEKVTQMRDACE